MMQGTGYEPKNPDSLKAEKGKEPGPTPEAPGGTSPPNTFSSTRLIADF